MDKFQELVAITKSLFRLAEKEGVLGVPGDGLLFTKQNGLWHWSGVVSNNFLDSEEQIITEKAHRGFVQAVDTGAYKGVFGHEMPELWLWHLPIPIGVTKMVAYDERGFLVAAGVQKEGDFYTEAFESLAKYERRYPGDLAMSHGVPHPFIEWDVPGEHLGGYLSKEFTFLPRWAAANRLTAAGATLTKEQVNMLKGIPEHKQKWFEETFGSEWAEKFDGILSRLEADAAGLPSKEKGSMSTEKAVATEEEAVEEVEGTAQEEVVEEVGSEEPVAEAASAPEAEKATDQVDDEEEDDEEEGAAKEAAQPEYVTPDQLKEIVAEITKGIAQAIKPLHDEMAQTKASVEAFQKELDGVKRADEEKALEKAQQLPFASRLGLTADGIAKSIVGSPEAKAKEDELPGPQEAEEKEAAVIPGVPNIIAKQIQAAQRQNGRRVYPGQ